MISYKSNRLHMATLGP